jgi:hypothetical protein
VFGLQREAPAWLVSPFEGDGLLGDLECSTCVPSSEPGMADALKQVEQLGPSAVDLAVSEKRTTYTPVLPAGTLRRMAGSLSLRSGTCHSRRHSTGQYG